MERWITKQKTEKHEVDLNTRGNRSVLVQVGVQVAIGNSVVVVELYVRTIGSVDNCPRISAANHYPSDSGNHGAQRDDVGGIECIVCDKRIPRYSCVEAACVALLHESKYVWLSHFDPRVL